MRQKGLTRPAMKGRAFHTVEEAADFIRWAMRAWVPKEGTVYDFYACLSLCGMEVTKTARASGRTYMEPVRQIGAMRASRVLYADLDVKPGAYASKADAHTHIDTLVASGDLPATTMRVDSGNGVHVYWILDRELNQAEWACLGKPFSDYLRDKGVHHDVGITSDPVRVLRVPGTMNCKDPANPLPVAFVGSPSQTDIPVAVFEKLLSRVVTGARPVPQHAVLMAPQAQPAFVLPDTFNGVAPLTAPSDEPEFGAGVVVEAPLDFARVVASCPTLADIHARHGAGDSGELWMLAVLAATFAPPDEARRWAHEFGSAHALYTPADTDAKFDEKMRARTQSAGRIGWPSCDAFSRRSAKCQTCPMLGRGKSPMHAGTVQAAAPEDELPEGYFREAGAIWTTVTEGEGDDTVTHRICVMPYDVAEAHIEDTPAGRVFVSQVLHRKNPPRTLALPVSAATSWREAATNALGAADIVLHQEQVHQARRFFVAYIQVLQERASTVHAREPFGWVKARDNTLGFSYGGRVYRGDGQHEVAALPDRVLQRIYQPTGELSLWKQAADMVMGMGRIDIQAIVASAFAAPLLYFSGQTGVIFSAYSPTSGTQKSTALKVAQSVWGNPVAGMNRLDDTLNAVGKKLGQLRHLPVCWDELQQQAQAESFASLGFALTLGTEKGRMGADTQLREAGSWATMLVACANTSIREIMLRGSTQNSAAGVNRLVEVRVASVPMTTSAVTAAMLIGQTHDNFGHAGAAYAQALARLAPTLKARLARVAESIEKATGNGSEERFWTTAAATMLLGAAIANTLDGGRLIQFDVPALHSFLVDAIKRQQVSRADDVVATETEDFAVELLQGYIAWTRQRNECLETDNVPHGAGRPKPVELRMPNQDALRMMKAPTMHIVHDDGHVRILIPEFRQWVVEQRKTSFEVARSALEKFGSMQKVRARWAAGTAWSGALQWFFQIDVHHARTPLGARFDYGHTKQQGVI